MPPKPSPSHRLVVKLTLGAAGKQAFGVGHTDDVYALAVSPGGKEIASGQLGELPLIILWDAETMSIRRKISGFHSDGISLLAYSPDGSMIASCGLDQQNSIAIYSTLTGSIINTVFGGVERVLDICFAPIDSRDAEGALVQVGVNHVKYHAFSGRCTITKDAVLVPEPEEGGGEFWGVFVLLL